MHVFYNCSKYNLLFSFFKPIIELLLIKIIGIVGFIFMYNSQKALVYTDSNRFNVYLVGAKRLFEAV